MVKNIIVSGAGPIGALLSLNLAKRGYNVKLLERRADFRSGTLYAGRSINIALSDRGWRGIEQAGITEEIRKIAIPMYGRYIHNLDGSTVYMPYGKDQQAIYSVSRAAINITLLNLASQHPAIEVLFNQKTNQLDLSAKRLISEDTQTGLIHEHQADLFFGSDGAFSGSRLSMQLQYDRFEYQQHYIPCAYKELIIPPDIQGGFKMEKNALHIWPRGQFMMIALPNPDGNFTCTLFLPAEGPVSFSKLTTPDEVMQFFKREFSDAVPLMPTLCEDFFNNPTSSLVTVKCYPWVFKNTLALIGDAAHAIVPFYGQGMNCGFEDCMVLSDLLDRHREDWSVVLPEYQRLRKPDGDAIADLAIANFYEMSASTADPKFLLQKKIEARFAELHPDKWIPLYSMVTFSPELRYSEALRRGNVQQAIMNQIMSRPEIESEWNQHQIETAILEALNDV